jgi:hypothetical protein
MDTGYWWESDTLRDQYEEQDVGGGIIFKWILDRQCEVVLAGFIWLRLGTSEGLL